MAVMGATQKIRPKSNPYRGFGHFGHGPLDKMSRNEGFGHSGQAHPSVGQRAKNAVPVWHAPRLM